MGKKDAYDRLNETLDEITHPAWRDVLFTGYNTSAVRKIVLRDIDKHWSDVETMQLSQLLSLGGVRLIKRDAETETRALKRLGLMFHRVPGYHTAAETESFKATLVKQSRADAVLRVKYEVQRALRFMVDEEHWARDIARRYGGSLTHYYNQGKDNRLNQFDKTENGWCLGMSVHWLGCKAQKMEFWETHLSEMGAAKYRFVMAAQGVRTAIDSTGDRASFRLAKFGLKKAGETRINAQPQPQQLASALTSSGNPYLRIGQYYVDGGGHAMAACLEKGGITFMDPNLGEFFFHGLSGFEAWLPLFMRKMDYQLDEFYVERYAGGAAPAPDFLKEALAGRRVAMGYDD